MTRKDKAKTIQYNNEFNKLKYDRITIMLPKGDKDTLQAAADQAGQSVNAYIKQAIQARLATGK